MAKAQGPTLLSGKIGTLIFRVRDGKNIVSLAPSSVNPRNATTRFFDNRIEFGGAAKMAAQIYQGLHLRSDEDGPAFGPYPQNRLTGRIRRAPVKSRVHIVGEQVPYNTRFHFHDVARSLRGLDLGGKEAPTALVQMTPIGPQHNPTAIKLTGIGKAARQIPVHGNARLEFHIRQTEIKDIYYNTVLGGWQREDVRERPGRNGVKRTWLPPSDWIPVEIFPADGLTLPVPATDPARKHLTAIFIEWREIRQVGRRIIRHHRYAIARIAALHAPAEAWASPSHSNSHSHSNSSHHITPRNLHPKPTWQQDPQKFLTQALANLFPEPLASEPVASRHMAIDRTPPA
ncbi:MAG TPA: hypothetical protein VHS96_17040 [Bacteroidia bacterium]|nr:hypothetical protein [Bacteroidia bacterium]